MGKIMLNGVDYSAAVTGGGKSSLVVYEGCLKSGSTCIDLTPYGGKCFYGELSVPLNKCDGGISYTGIVKGYYIIARVVGSVQSGMNNMFCQDICFGVPESTRDVTLCLDCVGVYCHAGPIKYPICIQMFDSINYIYPPNEYGSPVTSYGGIRLYLTINHVDEYYDESTLNISIDNPNGIQLHRVELL